MSRIFAIHGIARRTRPNTFVHRSYLSSRALQSHLKNRKDHYVSLEMALSGQGDALTIDDATNAGYDAAVLARKFGHDVTLFINPHNVINQSPYFLFVLDVTLDKTRRRELFWNGSCFPMNSYKEKLGLRNELKNFILKLTTESERMEFVQRLAIDLDVPDFSMPEHLRVLCIEQILVLRDMGVSIANHGWTHGAVEAMEPSAVRDEIIKAKKWITQTCGAAPSSYAVPFGNAFPSFEISDDLCAFWLLLNSKIKPGFVAPKVFNRETPDVRS